MRERVGLMDVGTLGEVPRSPGRDAARSLERRLPGRIDDLAPGRSRYVLALDEAGLRRRRRAAVRARGRLVPPHVHLGRRRTHGRPAAGLGRPPRPPTCTSLDRTARARGDPWSPARAPATSSRGLTDDPIDAAAFPYPGHREMTRRGRPVPRDPERVRRRAARSSSTIRAREDRSCGRALVGRVARSDLRRTGSTRSRCSGWRRATSTSARTRCPTTRRPSSVSSLGRGHGEAVVRRQAPRSSGWPSSRSTRRLVGLEFEGAPADAAELRGAPLIVGGAVVGRVTSARALDRARARDRARVDPRRSTDGFPDELDAGSGAPRRVVPTPVLRPRRARGSVAELRTSTSAR